MKVKIGNSMITIGANGAILRGPRGYSAYEIAVQNGYKGSEEEWISSLVGSRTASSYIGLVNKPSINNITLQGNKALPELGIVLVTGAHLENKVLVLEMNNGQRIEVDLSPISGKDEEEDEITQEEIAALRNIAIANNDNLTITYNNRVLDMEFSLINDNLIVNHNINGLLFDINNNGELEVSY